MRGLAEAVRVTVEAVTVPLETVKMLLEALRVHIEDIKIFLVLNLFALLRSCQVLEGRTVLQHSTPIRDLGSSTWIPTIIYSGSIHTILLVFFSYS